MKGFALILLCALVAVQARHTGVVKSARTDAALGENPWVVHLRIAISTSGLLETCAGTLIDNRWVLTAAECVSDARFIWIRYGLVDVIRPSFVTENSIVHLNDGLALININRDVDSTDNIAPTGLPSADDESPSSGKLCIFGDDGADGPGEVLRCSELDLAEDGDSLVGSGGSVAASRFDLGAGLIADNVQVGVLTKAADGDNDGVFVPVNKYVDWIATVTGINVSAADAEVNPDSLLVHFVN